MSSFAILVICAQACLLQNVYSQCLGPAGYGYGPGIVPGIAPGIAPATAAAAAYGIPGAYGPIAAMELGIGPYGMAPAAIDIGGYGGAGVGDVAVAGEMPVAGTTLVAGQVPILGAVRFAGELPAAGTVTIAGSCGCGYGSPAFVY